jgi:Na+/H+-dicarboxylate symporter
VRTPVHNRPSLASLIAPLVPVLVALGVVAVEHSLGDHLDHAAWLMAFALVALVLARQALIVFELLGPGNDSHDGTRQRITHAALREDLTAPVRLGGYEPH